MAQAKAKLGLRSIGRRAAMSESSAVSEFARRGCIGRKAAMSERSAMSECCEKGRVARRGGSDTINAWGCVERRGRSDTASAWVCGPRRGGSDTMSAWATLREGVVVIQSLRGCAGGALKSCEKGTLRERACVGFCTEICFLVVRRVFCENRLSNK